MLMKMIKAYYLDEESGLKFVFVCANKDNLGLEGLAIFTGDSGMVGCP
jgi:hypothetical protein